MFDSSPILFERPCGAVLKLTEHVVVTFHPFVQNDTESTEAGGVLLGRRLEISRNIIVDCLTTPTDRDRRARFSFYRSHQPHQKFIDAVWGRSNGACNYLGEWHTHPEPEPTPSCRDRQNWKRLLEECEFEGESLLFVVVGTDAIGVWEGDRVTKDLSELTPIP